MERGAEMAVFVAVAENFEELFVGHVVDVGLNLLDCVDSLVVVAVV